MKLMQLNGWGGRLGKQIVALIKSEDPDVVCLQEAISIKGGNAAYFLTVEDIQEELDYRYRFFSSVHSQNFMRRKMDYGNCILSKFPIIEENTIFTNLEYNSDFDILEDNYNIRNLQHVILDIKGRKLNVLNHHGYHIRDHKNGDKETIVAGPAVHKALTEGLDAIFPLS